MSKVENTSPFRLNKFDIYPDQDQIILGSNEYKLEPKVMLVLLYLAKHQDRVVTVDELLESLWSGMVVTPKSVQRTISELRKVFALDCGSNQYIQTFSKRGYRLVVPVSPLSSPKRKLLYSSITAIFSLIVIASLALFWLSPNEMKLQSLSPNNIHRVSVHPSGDYYASIEQTNAGFLVQVIKDEQPTHTLIELDRLNLLSSSLRWSDSGDQLALLWSDGEAHIRVFQFSPNEHEAPHTIAVIDDPIHRYRGVDFINDRQLVVTRSHEDEYNFQTLLMDIQTGESTRISELSKTLFAVAQRGIVAMTQMDGKQQQLHFYDVATQSLLITHTVLDEITGIEWPANSKELYYFTPNKIMKISLNGELTEVQKHHEGSITSLSIADDFDDIYWTEQAVAHNIIMKGVDGCCIRRITDTDADEYNAKYSPDGRSIAYISKHQGAEQLWLYQNDAHRQLTAFSKPTQITKPLWGADSQHIVFKNQDTTFRYTLHNQQLETLIKNNNFLYPIGMVNNDVLIFVDTNQGTTKGIWQKKLSTGELKQLDIPISSQAFVLDGKVFYQEHNRAELMQYMAGSAQVITTMPHHKILHLDRAPDQIFYRKYKQGEINNIYRYELSTQQHSLVIPRLSYQGKVNSVSQQGTYIFQKPQNEQGKLYKQPLTSHRR
ncbi:winged helix-turn-helix domain-containing protein [Echinimonas agarilytica]|uniref:Winged helix-turn-helix domain-containing protein n=1 Tax=Echinimonas agarilytica TaxID=1215918 RepID=A0AA41W3X0_9GAMM|nr:winged helix-turn-helix domain-containing protein [Echinimonas agarilytica]MCM2678103.1 winged helix-turn-helix domain-containing protein [Echinimonas agarilytica]